MHRTEVMLKIMEIAKAGGALPPDEALAVVATMIDKLDMYSDTYELDVQALMKAGATIWKQASASNGTHDMARMPPFLRR